MQCITCKSVIAFNMYSIDEYDKKNKNSKNHIWQKLMNTKLFIDPCEHSLEYEQIPQTVQEFNAYKWPKPTPKTSTIYILPINSYKYTSKTSSIKQPPSKKRKLNKSTIHCNCVDA